MKRSFLSLCILFLFSSSLYANELEQVQELDTIVVNATANGESLTQNSALTKFEHDVLDVPFNRSFMSNEQLKQQDIQRVDDAIHLVSGVFHQSNYGGGFWDNYSFRGFGSDPDMGATTIRNGLSVNRGISSPKDMVNLESMDFLKGAGATVYGRGETGGLLNVTTKKPSWDSQTIVNTQLNSDEQYRLSVEHTAPINDQLAYRIAIAGEDNQSFRDHVETQRLFVAPQLSWKISDRTQLDFESEFLKHKGTFDRGLSTVNQQFVMNRETFTGEPDDINTLKDQFYQFRLNHLLNDDWNVKGAISYKQTELAGTSTEPRRMLADGVTLLRFRRERDNESQDILAQAEILGKMQQPWAMHELLLSAEAGQLEYRQKLLRRNPVYNATSQTWLYGNPIDIRHGQQVYGNQLYQLTSANQSEDFKEQQRYFALNVQDQLFFNDKWSALVGARFDYVQQQFDNYNTAQYPVTQQSKNHHQLSPRFGLNYKLKDNLSFYANYGHSFAMNSRLDKDGNSFEPEKGKNYEIGAKYQFSPDSLLSLAMFNANKRNILADDGSGYYRTIGEATSKGVELDVNYAVTPQLNVSANYAYTDARVKHDPNPERTGERLSNIPKHSGAISANYEFIQQDTRRAGVGGTWAYVGERSGHYVDNGFTLPDYHLLNLHGYYQPSERVRYQLNVNNVLDKSYYPASYSQLWIQAGEPRNASLAVQWKF